MKIRKASLQEWDEFLEHVPEATFFHTPQWYQVWADYAGLKIETRIFEFESGAKALLPLASKRMFKGWLKSYISSPEGTYGGIITLQPLSDQEVHQIDGYLKTFSALSIRQSPFSFDKSLHANADSMDFTQTISLRDDWGKIIRNWSKGHLSAARKSKREGVKIQVAQDFEDWRAYFFVYQDSLKRWGEKASNNYSLELFKLLQKLPTDICKLWVAKYSSKIISGCVCFYYKRHIVYWHSASLSDFFSLHPAHLLQYSILKDAFDSKGYHWYDFNPSGGHEGVVKFKSGFGAKTYGTSCIKYESFLNKGFSIISNEYNKCLSFFAC